MIAEYCVHAGLSSCVLRWGVVSNREAQFNVMLAVEIIVIAKDMNLELAVFC